MQTFSQLCFNNKKVLVLFTFILAFTVRLYCVYSLPEQNNWIDLSIYRDGGQLVSHGINPYKYSDGIEMRNKFRLDTFAFVAYVSESQDRWNYYASGNLPLSLQYYGAIDKISDGSPIVYRIVFALFDSLLSALIVIILIKYWCLKKSFLNLILILGLGALSPTLLLWGSVFPEDKGLQILLMLLSVYLAKDKKWVLSAIFLGCSIAFKGLGVFIVPVCLFFVIGEPQNIFKINRPQIIRGFSYTLLTLLFAGIWFVPYMPDVLFMMQKRIASNLDVVPEHASIWIFAKTIFAKNWFVFKNIVIVAILLLWSYKFIYKTLNITAISIFLLVLFVDILLLAGSMDRMNIGVVVSIVVFGFVDSNFSKILGWYTILAGCLLWRLWRTGRWSESWDALYLLGFVILFSLYPLFHDVLKKYKQTN